MPKKTDPEKKILQTLTGKSLIKQQVYDNTRQAFRMICATLQQFTERINLELEANDPRIRLVYQEKSEFNVDLKVAGDILVFDMHSNIFQFDRQHEIWKTAYIKNDFSAGYSGTISIYNFLADSLKYRRMEDLGYLIARIFINKNNHFFVQGKRQSGFNFTTLGSKTFNQQAATKIIQTAVQYALDFDLLVPPYDAVKMINLAQVEQNISDSRIKTGKRLGFQFRSDDVGA